MTRRVKDSAGNWHNLEDLDNSAVALPEDLATESYVDSAVTAAVAALVDAAPGALNTLNELAAALGDDANFASSVTTALASKAGIVNTDDDPGRTIYVGATNPAEMDPPATLAAGDIWIDTSA